MEDAVETSSGTYTVIFSRDGSLYRYLRHGQSWCMEPWNEPFGKMIHELARDLEAAREEIKILKKGK